MQVKTDFDIVVIGGGIVGLAVRVQDRAGPPGRSHRRAGKGRPARGSPDRPQLRRDPFRTLLQARLGEGRDLHRRTQGAHRIRRQRTVFATTSAARSSWPPTRPSCPPWTEYSRTACRTGSRVSRRIGPERIKEIEPCAAGIAALHVPIGRHHRLRRRGQQAGRADPRGEQPQQGARLSSGPRLRQARLLHERADDQRDVQHSIPHQLRRPAVRQGRPDGRRRAVGSDRPVPGRLLGAEPRRGRQGAEPHLSRPEPAVPVPRRAFHADGRRVRRVRARTPCFRSNARATARPT